MGKYMCSINRKSILWIGLLVSVSSYSQLPKITIDVSCKTGPVRKEILGQNIAHLNWYEQSIESPTFMSRIRELNSPIVRWPGGGHSQCYNWKTDSCIYFGKVSFGLNIIEIAELCDSIDAEIIMTVNFGTMHASDAKHLVEFCNGPVTSEWGRKRDSLGRPEPLNIRYWEIGNEFWCPMEWLYSWSAQSKRKYFDGGSEERRGRTPILPWSFTQKCYKGDIFISDGSPNQRFYIRFPKVAPGSDTVKIGFDTLNFEIWERVDSFNGVGPGNFYVFDYDSCILKFGDGINGNIPPLNHRILCEYTTTGHDGYIAFVDSMRSAESLIPIKIGSCMLPPPNWPQEELKAIFSRMDFYHEHQYVVEDTSNLGSYYERLAYADSLLREVFEFRDWFNTYAPPPYSDKDSIEICITEWNLCIFWPYIPTDHPITRVNVSLTSAIFAACRLGDFITYAESLNIGVVNHYRTYWWNHHLSLLSNIPNFTRRPQFYVLKMFTRAFGDTLVKNEVICDSFEVGSFNIPYINAYTSINASGDTLYLIVVNKDSSTNYETIVKIDGIILDSIARVFTLNGDSIYATNEEDSTAVIIRDSVITNVSDSFNYVFPAHSVTAMVFTGEIGAEEHQNRHFCKLYQNSPNPFTSSTNIKYSVASLRNVELKIYDLVGRVVKTLVEEQKKPGSYIVKWNGKDERGKNVGPGIYFYKLKIGNFSQTKKLLFLK